MFRKTSNFSQNVVQIWGNKESMNLNSMILTNIQSSNYYKQKLCELKTYHEIIDEIYYRVNHLEPWEKGSRRTQGLTGMCGGVRGVGGGGIVSTCFCLLYKIYTLKLSRKQLIGLMTHKDSPYIRALGFMYVRFTQNPQDLYSWYADYLDDEEEIDVKAGSGAIMQIGNMLKQWLTRLEWYDTLFPRIPVPIQNEINMALRNHFGDRDLATGISNSSRDSARKASPDYSNERSRDRSRTKSPYYKDSYKKYSPKRKNSEKERNRSRSRSPISSKIHRSGRHRRSSSISSSENSASSRTNRQKNSDSIHDRKKKYHHKKEHKRYHDVSDRSRSSRRHKRSNEDHEKRSCNKYDDSKLKDKSKDS